MTKISIVTATYNAEKFIERNIQNIISQNVKNVEHILVDGMSTDKTLDIVDKHRSHFSKIIIEKDYGIYDAMNKGILAAKGDLIGILNADDYYNKDTLNLILKKLKPIGLYSLPMVHYQITYGGRFAPHTDVTSDPRFKTIVVLLSSSTEYSGGVLSIEGSSVNTNQGNVIVFDVRKLHEVSELVSGERHTLVMWTNKDNFNIPKTIL